MKNRIVAKAMLIVLVLGLSTFFGSLAVVQAGPVPSEIQTIDSQMNPATLAASDLVTPDKLEIHDSAENGAPMTPAEVKAELNQLYHKDTISIKSEQMRSASSTNQLIVRFSSFDTRDAFVSTIPSGESFNCLQTLPYVIVPKTMVFSELLVESQGVARITEDRILASPEYQVYEHTNSENELAMYSSEGRIGTWDMHSLGYTGKGVRIAILDTGIDSTHPDLMYNSDGSTKIIAQQSFVDIDFDGIPDEGPEDLNGHGTHVAGTAAGNGYQIGVAPDAFLLNAKVCAGSGCATSWMIEAVEWAILNDADIISMSIGGSTFWGLDALDDMLDYAWQQGIVVAIAAGNAGPVISSVESPGIGPRVITVAASDCYDLITAFSGRGPSAFGHYDPDIAAPGDLIFSTLPGGTYGVYGGTSMATPHVAGAIALLLEAHPCANPDMVKANLMANAKNVGLPTNVQGEGLLDLVTTHEEWSRRRAILFPTFNEQDILYLSPGETFSGFFSYVNSRRDGIQPWFRLDRSNAFEIEIERESLFPDLWKDFFCRPSTLGQQFIPFTVTAPVNVELGTQLSRNINVYFWKGIPWSSGGEHPLRTKMTLTIEIVPVEDDASTGTDAGDTFPGATEIPFGTYSAYLSDIDFYKVWLEADQTYTFVLDGLEGFADYDLAIYNETAHLVSFGYTAGPEYVILTTETAGYYTLRVDPWSLLLDPWINRDTSGPYILGMEQVNLPFNVDGESDSQIGLLEAEVFGEESNLVDSTVSSISEIINVVDYGLDTDSDSTFDSLMFDVNVNIGTAGYYSAVLDPWLWSIPDQVVTIATEAGINDILWLEPGYHTMQIQLSGEALNSAGNDGPFLGLFISLEAYDFGEYGIEFLGYVDRVQNYVTNTYSSSDFDTPGAKFVQITGMNYVDLDVDGEAESIEVFMEFDVGYAGLFDSVFNFAGYPIDGLAFAGGVTSFYFDTVGLQTASIILDGHDIYKQEYQGQMHLRSLEVVIFDPELRVIQYSENNGLIDVDYELLPGAKPAAEISFIDDYGIDANGNGLFESLAVSITVDVAEPMEFIIYFDMFGDASTYWMSYIGFYQTYFTAFEPGLVTVELIIPASDIAASVFDEYTNFELWITLMDTLTFTEVDFVPGFHTNWYYISDFEVPWMYSVGYYTYDADGDFCDDTIDIFVDFAFYSLIDVTVDLYIDVWFWNETDSTYLYIGTAYDGFSVVENPFYYGTLLTYQADYDGIFAFVPAVYIDGELMPYEVIYWYDACTYTP